jgi:hypothetical protein
MLEYEYCNMDMMLTAFFVVLAYSVFFFLDKAIT